MMTAILTVRNILAERPLYDVWLVNQDAEYHESGELHPASGGHISSRLVPRRVRAAP